MYKRILVPLEHSDYDSAIVEHVRARALAAVLERGKIDVSKTMTAAEKDRERDLNARLAVLNQTVLAKPKNAEARSQRDALRLGMSIAIGIGLHNFSEGLAIGQSAHAGEVSLALLLVIGFAAHNATEGFGIVGPLAAADVRASWRWLAIAGLVGGGPTFLGTIVGTAFASTVYISVAFLSLAAGAILYVIGELFSAGRRLSWEITLWGILAGLTFATVDDKIDTVGVTRVELARESPMERKLNVAFSLLLVATVVGLWIYFR